MAKYLRKRKTPLLFWVLPILLLSVSVFFFLRANAGKEPVCEDYTLTLPEGFVLKQEDDTRSLILCGEHVAGGILHCPFGSSEPPALYPLNRQSSEAILATLKAADAPGTNPDASDYMDYMIEGGYHSYSCVASLINRNTEYKHYMIFCEKGILTLWFDTAQVESETMDSISSTFAVIQP